MSCSFTEPYVVPGLVLLAKPSDTPLKTGVLVGVAVVVMLALHVYLEYVLLWPNGPEPKVEETATC